MGDDGTREGGENAPVTYREDPGQWKPGSVRPRFCGSPIFPGHGYSYLVLCVLTLVYTFNYMDRQVISILLPPIQEDLNLSDTQLGFLTGITFTLFFAVACLPLSRLADTWYRKIVLSACMVVWSATTSASGLSYNFTQLAFARIGTGIGEAGCTPAAHSLIGDYFPVHKRAFALSFYSMGMYVGFGLGFALGGLLNSLYGWRMAFIILGSPGIIVALFVLLLVKEPPRGFSDPKEARMEYSFLTVAKFLFSMPTIRWVCLGMGAHAFTGMAFSAWIPTFFFRVHGMPPEELGQWISWILMIGGSSGAILGGWVSSHLRPTYPRVRLWISALGQWLSVPFTVIVLFATNKKVALLFLMPTYLCFMLYIGPVIAIVQESVPAEMRATATAVATFFFTILGGLGPQAVGITNDHLNVSHPIRWSLLGTAVLMDTLAGIFFLLGMKHMIQDLKRKTTLWDDKKSEEEEEERKDLLS